MEGYGTCMLVVTQVINAPLSLLVRTLLALSQGSDSVQINYWSF